MIKQAYEQGNLAALHALGLIPQESLNQLGFPRPTMYAENQTVGLTPYMPGVAPFPDPKENGIGKTIRKVGPAAGASIGALAGALARKPMGGLGRGIIAGLGTGATLGWMPDVFATAGEALRKTGSTQKRSCQSTVYPRHPRAL